MKLYLWITVIFYTALIIFGHLSYQKSMDVLFAADCVLLPHFLGFLLFGILLACLFNWKHWATVIGAVIVFIFFLEIAQEFVPFRTFEWLDIFQDILGLSLGFYLHKVLHKAFI
jgi:VanZ family protein